MFTVRGNIWALRDQKQSSKGVPKNICSENMQQIYRRTPMPKCDFNKVAFQLSAILSLKIAKGNLNIEGRA